MKDTWHHFIKAPLFSHCCQTLMPVCLFICQVAPSEVSLLAIHHIALYELSIPASS